MARGLIERPIVERRQHDILHRASRRGAGNERAHQQPRQRGVAVGEMIDVGLLPRRVGAARELQAVGTPIYSQRADVTKSSDVDALIKETETALGAISILVNNAGMGLFGPVQEKTEQQWDTLMNTNLKSVFLVSRQVIPGMIQRKSGDIINISSLAGKSTFAGGGIYCASKWALQGLSGCMAEDLRNFGIRVSTVCPGSVATEFSGRGPKDASKVLTAQDVAHAVAMIATQGPQSFLSEVQLRPLTKP